jgi:hypothetical protein
MRSYQRLLMAGVVAFIEEAASFGTFWDAEE